MASGDVAFTYLTCQGPVVSICRDATVKHDFQGWLRKQRRTGRALVSWAAEEAFGQLGKQAQEWDDKGLVIQSLWNRWKAVQC